MFMYSSFCFNQKICSGISSWLMNRSSMLLLFSLLLLPSLLNSKSQGIRLDEGFSWDMQLKHQVQNSGGCDDEEANLCNHVHNYTAGKKANNRKLLVSTSISSTHTMFMSKKEKMVENNKNAKVSWVATSLKKHEELVDIAEMDYTAPSKKPPIHN